MIFLASDRIAVKGFMSFEVDNKDHMTRVSSIRLTVVAMVMVASAAVSTANAESVMKQCGEQWQAAKAAGTTNGEAWPQFLKDCRARLASTAPSQGGLVPAAPAAAPAPQSGSLLPWQQPAAPTLTPVNSGAHAPARLERASSHQSNRPARGARRTRSSGSTTSHMSATLMLSARMRAVSTATRRTARSARRTRGRREIERQRMNAIRNRTGLTSSTGVAPATLLKSLRAPVPFLARRKQRLGPPQCPSHRAWRPVYSAAPLTNSEAV